jgi:hypothetical protein
LLLNFLLFYWLVGFLVTEGISRLLSLRNLLLIFRIWGSFC